MVAKPGDGGGDKVRGNDDFAWTFTAIPDRVPTIALAKEPETQGRGTLLLVYKMEDDYGVVEAKAKFALKDAAPTAPAGEVVVTLRPLSSRARYANSSGNPSWLSTFEIIDRYLPERASNSCKERFAVVE